MLHYSHITLRVYDATSPVIYNSKTVLLPLSPRPHTICHICINVCEMILLLDSPPLRFISMQWNAIKLVTFTRIVESHWHLRAALFKGETGSLLRGQSKVTPLFSTVINIKWKKMSVSVLTIPKKENLSGLWFSRLFPPHPLETQPDPWSRPTQKSLCGFQSGKWSKNIDFCVFPCLGSN